MTTGTPGSVSSGTLRTEDLLGAFADALRELATSTEHRRLADEASEADPESENAGELVNELQDALQEYSLPYFYFGTHPGDGADFGFWLDDEGLDDVARIGDPSELDTLLADVGEAYHVNDHGNGTLYARTENGWREVWALV